MAESSTEAHDDGRAAVTAVPRRYLDALHTIWTHLSHGSAGSRDARTLCAVDAKGYVYVAAPGGSAPASEKDSWEDKLTIFKRSDLNSSEFTPSCVFDFEFQGRQCQPSGAKSWRTNPSGMRRLIEAERLFLLGDKPYARQYLGDFGYQNLENSWHDTAAGFTHKKVFVVQTSQKVIERCLLMTTDPGDLVLDPTCGSGTTGYVAEQWGRRWITIDTSRVAIAIARQRLLTAKFDYYELKNETKGVGGGFESKTVPYIKLKSVAQNTNLDPIFTKHEPIVERALAKCNDAVAKIPPDLRAKLATKLASSLLMESPGGIPSTMKTL